MAGRPGCQAVPDMPVPDSGTRIRAGRGPGLASCGRPPAGPNMEAWPPQARAGGPGSAFAGDGVARLGAVAAGATGAAPRPAQPKGAADGRRLISSFFSLPALSLYRRQAEGC